MKPYRHDARSRAEPAQRHGDGAAPRPSRRPLDRHPRRRPRPHERRGRRLQALRATTPRSRTASAPRRHRHPRGRRAARSGWARTAAASSASTRRRERFTHYRYDADDPASLSGDRIATLAEAADGRLWVGTMEKGLNLLDPRTGRFERFAAPRRRRGQPAHRTPSTRCTWTWRARCGWARTAGSASCSRTATFKTFTTRNGLPSDVVYAIANDRQGRLWLSTNNGLTAFDPRTSEFANYGVSNGLQASEFNFGAWYQSTERRAVLRRPERFQRLRARPHPPAGAGAAGGPHRPERRPPPARRAAGRDAAASASASATRCWAWSSRPWTSPPPTATCSPTSSRASIPSGCRSAASAA